MKYVYILLISLGMTLFSCGDYLDVDQYFNDMLTIDTVFVKKSYTEQWLWNTYSYMNERGAEITRANVTAFNYASDDCLYGDQNGGVPCEAYQNAQYSSSAQLNENRWAHLYQGIRQASIFISNVDRCIELKMGDREDYRAQARFLRAYYYWMLMKQYGPVPIIQDEGQDVSLPYEELGVPRNSYDECVEYVVAELEQAARVLPPTRPSAWYGQATRGAALATRAKVLLYAASPLYNGNEDLKDLVDNTGRILINQTYDEAKWARAAAAAKDVIDLDQYELLIVDTTSTSVKASAVVPNLPYPDGAGNVDAFESYRQCFNGGVSAAKNREFILTRQNYAGAGDLNWIAFYAVPFSLGGQNTICATQKQVDAYYMFDGKDKNQASAEYPYQVAGFTQSANDYPFVRADVSLMYVNREPRFYGSISYSGTVWEYLSSSPMTPGGPARTNSQIFYYKGTDGKQNSTPDNYLRTGIGVKKYYNPEDSWSNAESADLYEYKVEPTIRYADVLLWYAEALNELTKSYDIPSYDTQRTHHVSRNVSEMKYAFSRIRYRAGLPDAATAEYSDAATFRKILKRERQIELFMESARYFDLRRWKDAEKEENQRLMGLNIDMMNTVDQKQRFYEIMPVSMRKIFMKKMYLWPIPFDDLKKNGKLTQNPGWE